MQALLNRASHLKVLWQEESPARRGHPPGVPVSDLGEAGERVLPVLREAAKQARCQRHMTLHEAHRCLVCPGAASGAAEALVKTLSEVIGRRPVFYAPGTGIASFDEAWLVQCHATQSAGDVDSLALLVGRRVAAPLRRPFLDLLRSL
ncbi:MAG: hypothetical protein AAGG09_17995 [Pseudomonadota bacterium]